VADFLTQHGVSYGSKKGKMPAHIQPKQFQHPGTDLSWVYVLNQVEDLRHLSCNTRHSVTTILFIVDFCLLIFPFHYSGMRYTSSFRFSKVENHSLTALREFFFNRTLIQRTSIIIYLNLLLFLSQFLRWMVLLKSRS